MEKLIDRTGFTETQLQRIEEDINEMIFRSIDIDADYIVCNDTVSAFVTKRLLSGMPVAIVSQRGLIAAAAPRDNGIYRLRSEMDIETHNSINIGFAGYMLDCGLGVRKLGADITALDIIVCSRTEVLMRLQAQES